MTVKCPKPGCGATFGTDKACKKHCDELEDHDYCKKCDYLAKDWDDLTNHKANSPIVHLCCKFCGQDFKTSSGRDRHIKTIHPVDQDIRCIGCNEHFVRAAALVEHLEFDHCRKISAQQFKSNIQHKHMVAKILSDPDAMSSKLFDFNVNDTSSQGGVALSESSNLLDEEDKNAHDSSQNGGSVIQPLDPRVKPRDPNAPRLGERWPSLPSHTRQTSSSTEISSGMAGISISGGSSGGARLPSSGTPSVKSPSSVLSDSTVKASESQAWTSASGASKKLFPEAEKTPASLHWEAALKARELEYEAANSTNMLMQRYWDPTHKDYNPERFFNPVIEMYSCPFPQCEENFREPFMLEYHINTIHGISQQRCPQCLKLFKSTTALVAHCEAPASTCGISRSDRYGQAIDQFSGGFLGAKDARRPDFTEAEREDKYTDKTKTEKHAGSGYKIGMIKYESTLPLDWPTESLASNTQIGRSWDEGGRGPNIGGNMNPAVPLSKSKKVHHSTANIYPQPFQDFVPEITPNMFAPPREQREKAQKSPTAAKSSTVQSSSAASNGVAKENGPPASASASKAKKKSKRPQNIASQLIDPEAYKQYYEPGSLLRSPEEPLVPMRRADAYYLSSEQIVSDGDGDGDDEDDGVSLSASSTRRSAWN
ncbi:Zinc finger protein 560 [Lasiodiplodia hormozganensis]|uniref:Zinc finger protein 560 n=1 Tax=Lasiodiplodia hormozganensis TaxID=869390 RepID=A0AA39T0R5_9PEZI|nr:Zinc finger protein 560 [Lasiodiplodia hormozganensis]